MFKFINNRMENKFINVRNAGWIGFELNPGDDTLKAWRFVSENGDYQVIAVYSKKTGKLQNINGGEGSMTIFLSSTEEHDVCMAFARMMAVQRFNRTKNN